MNKATKHITKEEKFATVRNKLMGMKLNLVRESKAELGQILNEGDSYSGVSDEGDLADISSRSAMQAANLNRHRAQLKAIEEALRKINEGTYGICEDCAGEIPVGRLNAMPFALRCVECQESNEMLTSDREESILPPSGESAGGEEED